MQNNRRKPKHGVLAWAVPLALSCHYDSRKLTNLTLVASWIFFSASIYIGSKGVPAALFMVIGKTLINDHTKPNIDAFVGEAPQFDDITMLCVSFVKKMAT